MARICTECKYVGTCINVDRVQGGAMECPLDSGAAVKKLLPGTIVELQRDIPGYVREARKRAAGMARLGIKNG